MAERAPYHSSREAQQTRKAVEANFQWRSPPFPSRYAPSPDQVLSEEAATEAGRAAAEGFVVGLVAAIAAEDDQAPLLLTADEVRARYELHRAQVDVAVDSFTLREAWGAAARMRGH